MAESEHSFTYLEVAGRVGPNSHNIPGILESQAYSCRVPHKYIIHMLPIGRLNGDGKRLDQNVTIWDRGFGLFQNYSLGPTFDVYGSHIAQVSKWINNALIVLEGQCVSKKQVAGKARQVTTVWQHGRTL
jgi:hypothetical protein